jgi:23S rRNA pseudouridine955/2504/2580 synthase/23S rRNA pseudouridine1911/1915/1917 synthase
MPPPKLRIALLLDDEDLSAIDKPAGVASVRERWHAHLPTAIDMLWDLWCERGADPPRPHVIHRLDKETSGVLLFARHADSQRAVRQQFRARTVEKRYFALTAGCPEPAEGTTEISIEADPAHPGRMRLAHGGGKACVTEHRTLAVHAGHAWVELRPRTGRTHQLRITLRELGAPCVADPYYGDGAPLFLSSLKRDYRAGRGEAERPLLGRLGLHAAALTFDHPRSGERITVEAPLPNDLRASLRQLERWG